MEDDYYDGVPGAKERVLIFDFEEGPNASLIKSFKRIQTLIKELPPSSILSLMLYDRYESGLRLGINYWHLNDDEFDDTFVTLETNKVIDTFGSLQRLTVSCTTERGDGDLVNLIDTVLDELKKNKWNKLVELSFSNVGAEDYTDYAELRLYFER